MLRVSYGASLEPVWIIFVWSEMFRFYMFKVGISLHRKFTLTCLVRFMVLVSNRFKCLVMYHRGHYGNNSNQNLL